MPNDVLSDAKAALGKSKTFTKSVTGKESAAPSAAPAAKVASMPAPAAKSSSLGDELHVKAENIQQYDKAVPKMHKGGKVDDKVLGGKKEGPVILEKGETVRTAKQEKDMKEKAEPKKAAELLGGKKKEDKSDKKDSKSESKDGKKGGKHKHTHIEHHTDGSHTVRHTPREMGDEVSYSRPDMAGMHAGLDENLGGGEAAAAEPASAGAAAMAGAPPMKA